MTQQYFAQVPLYEWHRIDRDGSILTALVRETIETNRWAAVEANPHELDDDVEYLASNVRNYLDYGEFAQLNVNGPLHYTPADDVTTDEIVDIAKAMIVEVVERIDAPPQAERADYTDITPS